MEITEKKKKLTNVAHAELKSRKPATPPSDAMTCSALRWTRHRPKAPGWYWLAAPVGYTPRIVRVWEGSYAGLCVQAEGGHFWPLKKRGGWKGCKWAGPILPPSVPARTPL